MDGLHVAATCALMSASWLLMMGTIRLIAYRSGTDHTPEMRAVALIALSLGALSAVAFAVLIIIAAV